ncbi:hlh transcription factor [Sporothrix schenckii 1099-18]|uniref:Hlh transcription factor n=1 Tax=Sporothrix schenckii 1099-18 TaxID=1397361 RepID=A0A0F2M6F0_SPOSC|nr:hlh transcription factor [Sporothrix schenckii 1099-18]KJR85212.1 hlh transcription factor [Sporothrix schenckii 1099-18]
MEQPAVATQKPPAGLAGVLNSPDANRDSAYYSITDASSKPSCAGLSPAGPSSSASPHPLRAASAGMDKTPSPTAAAHLLPQPLLSPSTSSMSVASIVSPTTPSSGDLRRLTIDRPQSLESAPNSASLTAAVEYDHTSRRESVDSRINQGIGDLRLGGNSPYATHNHSTTSVHTNHNSFQAQQRQPRTGLDSLSVHRISNGYQPSAERNPDIQNKTVRTAPAITGPAISQIARAAEPTKGQAWAFPEEEIQRLPSAASQSFIDSRRSSVADSLASSQFTTESRLPNGQRRFDDPVSSRLGPHDGPNDNIDYHQSQRLSGASGEYPTTHHHALQHKQIDDLQAETGSLHAGSQPYSRTPELRISHKLAERKRRTEMKELFEQLRDLMPQERGSKASKWEILTKAITEHQRLQETVRSATLHQSAVANDIAAMKNEMHALRMENQQLRADMAAMQANGGGATNGQAPPGMSDHFARGPGRDNNQQLPPLRSLSSGLPPPTTQAPPPESMTGVQYDQSRVNGFRPQIDRF